MSDADGKCQPIPEDVAAAQREAEKLESRQVRDSDDGNERQPDGGDRIRRLTLSQWPRYGFISKS